MKATFVAVSVLLALVTVSLFHLKTTEVAVSPIEYSQSSTLPPIDNMPLVMDDPFLTMAQGSSPQEQRGAEFARYLAVGVKIRVTRASGSGTIIYYNPEDGYAYVQSCGHLWEGVMNYKQRKEVACQVITWYHNEQKLPQEKTYNAEVLWYSNTKGQDSSLLRFKPDWAPNFFPIGPDDFQFQENMRLHSIGCDHGQEIAHYTVRYLGTRGGSWPDLVTTENSPRPGRSGGGLISDDGFYVGICWGTSEYSGNGNGFFTPLKTVRYMNEQNGFGWLNDVRSSIAREIPIIDRNNPQGKYPKDYIPLPGR